MNPITALLNIFKRERKPYLHEPIKFAELAFTYHCVRCKQPTRTVVTWQEWNQGKVRELQQQGLCEKCGR